MMTFRVQFHRYGNGHSRLSAVEFIQAETFHDAVNKAALMRSAMASVDRAHEYAIANVSADGYRGETCALGWETQEEFSARVIREMSDNDLSAELDRLQKQKVTPGSVDDEKRSSRQEAIYEEMERRGGAPR
jgi:hypothetical protein